jgi:hypothetical protein
MVPFAQGWEREKIKKKTKEKKKKKHVVSSMYQVLATKIHVSFPSFHFIVIYRNM